MNLNKVILVGHLTRDPELREFDNFKVCKFGIAVNTRLGKDKEEEVLFVDCSAWNKLADICMQYLGKGKAVLVEGRLKLDTWERDGKKNSKHSVVVDNMQMISGKNADKDDAPEKEFSPKKKKFDGVVQGNSAWKNFRIDEDVVSNKPDIDDLPF